MAVQMTPHDAWRPSSVRCRIKARSNSATPANIVSTMRPAVVVVSAQVSSRDCNPAFFSEITSADTLSTYRRQSPRAPFAHFGTLIPNRTFA